MRQRELKTLVVTAIDRAKHDIDLSTRGRGKYAAALAYEGYKGGYLAALYDIDALLRGAFPSDSHKYFSGPKRGEPSC